MPDRTLLVPGTQASSLSDQNDVVVYNAVRVSAGLQKDDLGGRPPAEWAELLGVGVPVWVERDFRSYLRCGILAHGFARARCTDCGHERLVPFSCKARGACPSCNARRMAEVAAHLTDHVLPHLPLRQWVLSLPKRLRPFLHYDSDVASAVLRVFLRAIRTTLRRTSVGAPADARLAAVSFPQRFGSSLNLGTFSMAEINDAFDRIGVERPEPRDLDPLPAG